MLVSESPPVKRSTLVEMAWAVICLPGRVPPAYLEETYHHFLSLDGAVLSIAIDDTLALDAARIADASFVAGIGRHTAGIAPKACQVQERRGVSGR